MSGGPQESRAGSRLSVSMSGLRGALCLAVCITAVRARALDESFLLQPSSECGTSDYVISGSPSSIRSSCAGTLTCKGYSQDVVGAERTRAWQKSEYVREYPPVPGKQCYFKP